MRLLTTSLELCGYCITYTIQVVHKRVICLHIVLIFPLICKCTETLQHKFEHSLTAIGHSTLVGSPKMKASGISNIIRNQ